MGVPAKVETEVPGVIGAVQGLRLSPQDYLIDQMGMWCIGDPCQDGVEVHRLDRLSFREAEAEAEAGQHLA